MYIEDKDIIVFELFVGFTRESERSVEWIGESLGLQINPKKFEFGISQIEFLGHLVFSEKIRVSPGKVAALQSMKSPTDKKALKT